MRLAGEQLAGRPGGGRCRRDAPASTWRPAAGLDVDDGVLVDEAQRTSAAGVLAAGDMARPRDGVRIEHWHAAREGGERAALAMLDQPLPPRRAPWFFSEVAGVTLDVLGTATAWDEIVAMPGLFAYVTDGRVVQLAVIDGCRRRSKRHAGWSRIEYAAAAPCPD